MWAEIKANIAAITPYQGTDPTLALAYRDQVGQAFAQGIIDQLFVPLVWTSGPDLTLGINQSAKITASAATSIPLHIACGDGQIYEMEIVGSYTPVAGATDSYLQPNNAVPATNAFIIRGSYIIGTTQTIYDAANNASGGFDLCAGGCSILESKSTIFTSTANKKAIITSGSSSNTAGLYSNWVVEWQDTTTVWSSLGTVIMPNAGNFVITTTRKA